MKVSIIDNGNKDFLHDEKDNVIILDVKTVDEAEDWLLNNESKTDWSNKGTRYHVWDED